MEGQKKRQLTHPHENQLIKGSARFIFSVVSDIHFDPTGEAFKGSDNYCQRPGERRGRYCQVVSIEFQKRKYFSALLFVAVSLSMSKMEP